MEIRLVKTGLDRRSYEDKLKAHDQMLAKLENELSWAKSGSANKGELFKGAKKSEEEYDPEAEGDQILQVREEQSVESQRQFFIFRRFAPQFLLFGRFAPRALL